MADEEGTRSSEDAGAHVRKDTSASMQLQVESWLAVTALPPCAIMPTSCTAAFSSPAETLSAKALSVFPSARRRLQSVSCNRLCGGIKHCERAKEGSSLLGDIFMGRAHCKRAFRSFGEGAAAKELAGGEHKPEASPSQASEAGMRLATSSPSIETPNGVACSAKTLPLTLGGGMLDAAACTTRDKLWRGAEGGGAMIRI